MQDGKLITLVQQHSELYDKTKWGFRNTTAKNEILTNIGKELGGIAGEVCSKRWLCLREKYCKEVRMTKGASGSGATMESKWPLFSSMHFLRGHIAAKSNQRSNFGTQDAALREEIYSCTQQLDSPTPAASQNNSPLYNPRFSPTVPYGMSPLFIEPPSPEAQSRQTQPSPPVTPVQLIATPVSTNNRQKRQKPNNDEDPALTDFMTALTKYAATSDAEPADAQAHHFGKFVEATITKLPPAKKMQLIAGFTAMVADIMGDEPY